MAVLDFNFFIAMVCETFYDELRDKGVAVPGLSQDLSEAIETGVINDLSMTLEFNDLDELSDIGNRVSDIFEAIEATKDKALNNARERVAELNNQPSKSSIAAPAASVTPSGEEA